MSHSVSYTTHDGLTVTIQPATTTFNDAPFRDVIPGDLVQQVSKDGDVVQTWGHWDPVAIDDEAELEFALAVDKYLRQLNLREITG